MTVDATWGTISPMHLAPGVATVGELEVIDQIAAGLPLVDTPTRALLPRRDDPRRMNIPHGQPGESLDSLSPSRVTIFFCNGPQCAATPEMMGRCSERLSAAGDPLLPGRDPRLDDARAAVQTSA